MVGPLRRMHRNQRVRLRHQVSEGAIVEIGQFDRHAKFCLKSSDSGISLCNLCVLCVSVIVKLEIQQPQSHREHRGCTEKRIIVTFSAKLVRANAPKARNMKARGKCDAKRSTSPL